jgi:hypothetical protein
MGKNRVARNRLQLQIQVLTSSISKKFRRFIEFFENLHCLALIELFVDHHFTFNYFYSLFSFHFFPISLCFCFETCRDFKPHPHIITEQVVIVKIKIKII